MDGVYSPIKKKKATSLIEEGNLSLQKLFLTNNRQLDVAESNLIIYAAGNTVTHMLLRGGQLYRDKPIMKTASIFS